MNTCITGDCRQTLRDLIAKGVKVQMCVTSPPYWGLRDYGTAKWEGGDVGCDHTGIARRCDLPGRHDKQSTQKGSSSDRVSRECLKCGATRIDSQLGLEKTPEDYVANLVEVFRLVRDVLRDDGVLFLNIGDSYNGSGGWGGDMTPTALDGSKQTTNVGSHKKIQSKCPGLKPKDLVGIPWMVAFALRADGWYLRSDIIWHKPNPMPESVTDRPTKSHEYMFLLSKSAKYFYDNEAVKERSIEPPRLREKNNGESAVDTKMRGYDCNCGNDGTRNLRSVWTIATAPYSEAHFATFPPALIIPCIKAGSRVGDTVIDPFFGSGTTGQVCEQLGRKWIGCELSEKYEPLWKKRTAQGGLGI
jgi:DNA modification methylase